MKVSKPLPYDIAVVGLGITGIHQITRESEETIKRCTETFVIDTAVGVLDYLKTLSPKITDLMALYTLGSHRRQIYRRMASEVVAAAMENPTVCFAAYGHPKMYCYPTTLIQRSAKLLNLKVQVFPGISCVDTLLVDLNLDPGLEGLQIYDATDLIVRRRPLQTDVSCIIMQAPIVLEAYNRQGTLSLENLTLLQNYLLEFYPADHKVVIDLSKTHPLLEPTTQKIALGNLAAVLCRSSTMGTLFIPPAHHREVANRELAAKLSPPPLRPIAQQPTKSPRSGRPKIGPQPS
jgi:uncharacterized protein YabN with tetrapyrrole methylase and pyrophosphatase domain